jgi:hypothetical protein
MNWLERDVAALYEDVTYQRRSWDVKGMKLIKRGSDECYD